MGYRGHWPRGHGSRRANGLLRNSSRHVFVRPERQGLRRPQRTANPRCYPRQARRSRLAGGLGTSFLRLIIGQLRIRPKSYYLERDVAWAPSEFGLMLACGSSDGSISILTGSADGSTWEAKKISNAHTIGCNAVSWGPSVAP